MQETLPKWIELLDESPAMQEVTSMTNRGNISEVVVLGGRFKREDLVQSWTSPALRARAAVAAMPSVDRGKVCWRDNGGSGRREV